jgi:hypothetical protein
MMHSWLTHAHLYIGDPWAVQERHLQKRRSDSRSDSRVLEAKLEVSKMQTIFLFI